MYEWSPIRSVTANESPSREREGDEAAALSSRVREVILVQGEKISTET